MTGFVHRMKPYGVFVEIPEKQSGLVHRSEILPGQNVAVEEVLWPGDQVKAVIKRVDYSRHEIRLSIADYLRREGRSQSRFLLTTPQGPPSHQGGVSNSSLPHNSLGEPSQPAAP